ncbi:lysostaphin resistance A-like protein [Marinobacter mobilis]|uniref:lysostaphin resistance A-like protein n=1 Tax=Marinobacter mobilis TaxID=488533 RepID=UPI0035C7633D
MLAIGIAYSLCLILAGLSRDRRLRYGGALAILVAAVAMGYSSWLFGVYALGYLLLSAWMVEWQARNWLRVVRYGLWVVATIPLLIHQAPGYEGLLVAEHVVLKPGSIATDLYFNHDKVWVAWSLLGWLPLFRQSLTPRRGFLPWLTPFLLFLGMALIMALAQVQGLVQWQPGVAAWLGVFALSNLLNTCIAEELLFRGVVQRQLVIRFGWIVALLVTSLLFGIAHLPGGWGYVLVAGFAGLVYGLAYLWTGRLLWAVLVHWLLNLSHILLFTYPMSA